MNNIRNLKILHALDLLPGYQYTDIMLVTYCSNGIVNILCNYKVVKMYMRTRTYSLFHHRVMIMKLQDVFMNTIHDQVIVTSATVS